MSDVFVADVKQIVLRHVRMPLRSPFVSAVGVEEVRNVLIVELHAGGAVGYGEVPVLSAPTYNEETVETAWHVLNDFFIPKAVRNPKCISARTAAADLTAFKGHSFAKAGLEAAVWDAAAKQARVSLSRLLFDFATGASDSSVAEAVAGAKDAKNADSEPAVAPNFGAEPTAPRRRVPSGVVVGMPSPGGAAKDDDLSRLLHQIETRLEERYRRIKLKVEPGRDVAVVRAVRHRFGEIALSVDANGTYGPQHTEALLELDEFGLSYIEQPLPARDVVGHAALQRRLKTPVCLDEGVGSAEEARQAIELGSCRVVNVKASRIGGFIEAVALHNFCRQRGVPVLCGGLLESGIGRAHNVALASLPGFCLPGDLSASSRYWNKDLVEPAFELDADGYIAVPPGPGIGVDVDTDFLEHVTVRRRLHRVG